MDGGLSILVGPQCWCPRVTMNDGRSKHVITSVSTLTCKNWAIMVGGHPFWPFFCPSKILIYHIPSFSIKNHQPNTTNHSKHHQRWRLVKIFRQSATPVLNWIQRICRVLMTKIPILFMFGTWTKGDKCIHHSYLPWLLVSGVTMHSSELVLLQITKQWIIDECYGYFCLLELYLCWIIESLITIDDYCWNLLGLFITTTVIIADCALSLLLILDGASSLMINDWYWFL